MFLKLAYSSTRNKLAALIQFSSPVINIIISVIISRSWNFISSLPPLTLSLTSGFKLTQTLISEKNLTPNSTENKYMTAYKDYFKESKYPGMSYTDVGTTDIGKFYLKLVCFLRSLLEAPHKDAIIFNSRMVPAESQELGCWNRISER